MNNIGVIQELRHLRAREILSSFSTPKTPRQVEKELGINKLKLKPLLKCHYLKLLNPDARKGRLYILTNKVRKLMGLPGFYRNTIDDWYRIGWIKASPRQRLVVLKAMDRIKRTSEEIRKRVDRYNSHLTRISTKQILKELIEKGLVVSEPNGRKRYYWINEKGFTLKNRVDHC
jgi:predicted transcriptional regulator